ncbi:WD40-repeat-containing domain protein [Truncatella angustata]|uniref:WD40-repeat-containing domain protein n=1 Tax=Truncatella angustata TaxID=152316 RepID=A0A9P9A189_9PEZI|nr:WD40-repeat-containing domain protein [Truncatella angustata]KAH6656780.1 WD40-repeat-containing domain protein [Truncatella angustata]
MSSTPSNRLRLTPSNSPFLQRPARSPFRGRPAPDPRLSLKRVIGTTCTSPNGFDTCQNSFAYLAGGAVVVVNVEGERYHQRFYRARPSAVPVYSTTAQSLDRSTPTNTPKANDSRNRSSIAPRDSSFGVSDWAESPSAKTWTSRERIKAATCLSLSHDGKYLAVGETGYSPRVLIFGLQDCSSDRPLVSISEHLYGLKAVAWSPNTKYLASLGSANDGFLYLWKIDPKTGAAKLYQQNRCVSYVRDMIWMGDNLITLGVRHVKVWKVEEPKAPSPTKTRFGDVGASPQPQKTLPGRNAILGELIEATFSCAVALDDTKAIICTELGDICLLDDKAKQMKLTKVLDIGFTITSVAMRNQVIHVGGKSGDFATLDLKLFLEADAGCTLATSKSTSGFLSLGFLENNLVTVDEDHSIDVWNASYIPGCHDETTTRTHIPGNGDAMHGVGAFTQPNESKTAFYTWSSSGSIRLWDTDGNTIESFSTGLEGANSQNETDPVNQMTAVTTTQSNDYFVTGDKLGILKVTDAKTKECVFETKAHSSNCQSVATYEDDSRFLIASCGRDRTAQLFRRASSNHFELFQTLEFAAKVVQVIIPSSDKVITCSLDRSLQIHEIVSKETDPGDLAAFPVQSLPLKASPTSMAMAPNGKQIIVSLLDRSICIYNIETGKLSSSFKCADETAVESVVLDSLICRPATEKEPAFLLGLSNTDKSIRIYDVTTGSFLDREWGHTEAITGVTLVQEANDDKKVVSVGSDGTIMIWSLDLQDQIVGSVSRDPSPVKDVTAAARAPLRRILSKADLAEFQRPQSASSGRRSPPRTLAKRRSLYNLTPSGPLRTPTSTAQLSPPAIDEGTPTRRTSTSSRTGSSPPVSPKSSRAARRPSLPALKKTKSSSSLRGSMNLPATTEQLCRTLRSFRRKLESGDSISDNILAELDQELRLTSLALGDKAKHSRELGNSLLDGILDQYSTKLSAMLDEKLRLNSQSSGREDTPSPEDPTRPVSPGVGSISANSNYSQ